MSTLTMKVIMKTFEEMIEEMPFDKITVLALVKRCEISHNTFYYHFQDIYELLDAWLKYEIDELKNNLEDPGDWRAEMRAVFQVCKDRPKVVNHILSSLSKERVEYHLFSQSKDSVDQFVRERASAGDMQLSDSQIADIAEFCRYAFSGYFLKFNYVRPMPDVDVYIAHFEGMFDLFVTNAIESISTSE